MTESKTSKMSDADWKYPQPACNASGHLDAADGTAHKIYWEEYGNKDGEPVMFLHGGPGGSISPVYARFFDPARYRVILFDQRGCGKSAPNAADDDPAAALANNTTQHLIGDIRALRAARGITGRMHVFGGSWGSTLSLAYAIAHPDEVATLVLRGIFLNRRKDLDYLYQGNAARYAEDPQDVSTPGAYMFFPDVWKRFVEAVPSAQRGDMVKAYSEILSSAPRNAEESARLDAAATAWAVWEGATSYLQQDVTEVSRFSDAAFARAFARLENHYFMNGAFLGGSGEENRYNDYLLDNIARIKDIPVHIVHGRYDVICPLFQAEDLVAGLRAAGAREIDYRITAAGHSQVERENAFALIDIMDTLPPLAPAIRAAQAG